MLNLSQRLILGYVVIAGLLVGLVELTHRALAAAGELRLAWIIVIAVIGVEVGAAFLVLRLDGLRAAALANLFFFILDFREEIYHAAVVFFKIRRFRLHAGF